MKRPIILAAVLLSAALAAAAQSPSGMVWQVRSYDLNVTLPQTDTVRTVEINAGLALRNVSAGPASTLTLRISPQAEVGSVTVGGSKVDFSRSDEKFGGRSLQRIVLRIPSVPSGGAIEVNVAYKLSVKENGPLASVSSLGAQFLPLSAWYPTPTSWYFARGNDTAPFTIRMTPPAGQTAVSAGDATTTGVEQKVAGQPFIVTGVWDKIDASGASVFVPKGAGPEAAKRASELGAMFVEARSFAAAYLGKEPTDPLKIVAVRRGAGFAGGGVVLVDEAVFRRPGVDSQTAMNIAEAAVRIWLGGSITASGDGFGVVSEGLTRYIATRFIEQKYGAEVSAVERTRQRSAYLAVSRRDTPMGISSPIDDFYFGQVANKGAMLWRLVARGQGEQRLKEILKANSANGTLTLADLRAAFSAEKDIFDNLLDKTTDMNLLAGIPQQSGSGVTVNLRNSGSIDATVNVRLWTVGGKTLDAPVTIRAQSFGEVTFQTGEKPLKAEIDTDKYYPQTEYFDDTAPRDLGEGDPLLGVKRPFDRQDHAGAEKAARAVLVDLPRFDEVRVLLGRSLIALGRDADAELEMEAVLKEKLPAARSTAWAMVGLAEIAQKRGRTTDAIRYAELAIAIDAEYGASFAARQIRNKIGSAAKPDADVTAYFAAFDKAASSNRKADIDALVIPGEAVKFAAGLAGSTEKWQTTVRQVDRIDQNTILVEANINIKMLNKDDESGLVVFRLVRSSAGWRLLNVDIFEVR
ncbi:MAG: hypothetical protein KF736_02030 [Acidobacteria bacterium]|nr:hypothetical protein [Acidobacteriota bacterium]MCW5949186.1 hypothetical protein [Pyrinomonadaceae bacterium]